MPDMITLETVVDAIVEACNEADARGQHLTVPQMFGQVRKQYPTVPSALLERAVKPAAKRLYEDCEDRRQQAEALEALSQEVREIERETGLTHDTELGVFLAAA